MLTLAITYAPVKCDIMLAHENFGISDGNQQGDEGGQKASTTVCDNRE